jgi:hypothetical protein
MAKKFWITTLIFGLPWSILMIVYYSISRGGFTPGLVISGLMGGLIFGILFAWSMQYATERLFKKIVVETSEGEIVVKEGGANHFRGKEGVGGKLVLTDRRLIFKSHKFNVQNHKTDFDLKDVEKLQATKTLNILENGLTIELANREKHKFVVDEPKEWIEKIMDQKVR